MGIAIVFLVGALFITACGFAVKDAMVIFFGSLLSIFCALGISILRRTAIDKAAEIENTEKSEPTASQPDNKDVGLSQQGLLYCRYCGKIIEKDSVFCKHCGRHQNKVNLKAFWAKNKRTSVVAGVLVIGLVIAAFVVPTEIKRQEKMRLLETGIVYVSKSGTKYHLYEDCSGMVEPREMTDSRAIELGKKRCTKCYEGIVGY